MTRQSKTVFVCAYLIEAAHERQLEDILSHSYVNLCLLREGCKQKTFGRQCENSVSDCVLAHGREFEDILRNSRLILFLLRESSAHETEFSGASNLHR